MPELLFGLGGVALGLVLHFVTPRLARLWRRRRLHPWYRHAVVVTQDGYSYVLDEHGDASRAGEQVLRRGLAQGQAYFLSMAWNDALKEADRAIEANNDGA